MSSHHPNESFGSFESRGEKPWMNYLNSPDFYKNHYFGEPAMLSTEEEQDPVKAVVKSNRNFLVESTQDDSLDEQSPISANGYNIGILYADHVYVTAAFGVIIAVGNKKINDEVPESVFKAAVLMDFQVIVNSEGIPFDFDLQLARDNTAKLSDTALEVIEQSIAMCNDLTQ